MKKTLLLLVAFCTSLFAGAQVWTGSINTDWNEAGNWSTNAVPSASGDVTIPGSLVNYPVLSSAITINSIDIQNGSLIDFGSGGSLFINTNSNKYSFFKGATINGSGGSINLQIKGRVNYQVVMGGCTITADMVLTLTGQTDFKEGHGTPNTFQHNLEVIISSSEPYWSSYDAASQFLGNYSVTRTVGGLLDIFNVGGYVAGDFSLSNLIGNGAVRIGSSNEAQATLISGRFFVDADYHALPNVFEIQRVKNLTPGGRVIGKNTYGLNLRNDTLIVDTIGIFGTRGNNYSTIYDNHFTGVTHLEDSITAPGSYGTFIRNNRFDGNFRIKRNGAATFYEADVASLPNYYNGEFTYIQDGTGGALVSKLSSSTFKGSVSFEFNNTGGGDLFGSGVNIDGDFSYTQTSTGDNYIGTVNKATNIGGKVDISINNSNGGRFHVHRLINQTLGGSISASGVHGFEFLNDTLIVNDVDIKQRAGTAYGRFFNNKLTGNLTIETDVNNSNYPTTIRSSEIIGNATFKHNDISNFDVADLANTSVSITGNVSIVGASKSSVFTLGNLSPVTIGGNLGISMADGKSFGGFYRGGSVGGNFSYTQTSTGYNYFGDLGYTTNISGKVDISINNSNGGWFHVYRLINQTSGGSIAASGVHGFEFLNDTLIVNDVDIKQRAGTAYGRFFNNKLTGNLTIETDVNNSNYPTTIRSSEIIGNATFKHNDISNFDVADLANTSVSITGNVSIVGASKSSIFRLGNLSPVTIGGNLGISMADGKSFGGFYRGGSVGGNFSYTQTSTGYNYFGDLGYTTNISGKVDISINNSSGGWFHVYRLINQTSGGSISASGVHGFEFLNDTLIVNDVDIKQRAGTAYGRFFNNKLTGNLTIENDVNNSNYPTTIRSSEIIGNAIYNNKHAHYFEDADLSNTGNTYNGNVTYNNLGSGSFNISAGSTNVYNGNVTVFGNGTPNIVINNAILSALSGSDLDMNGNIFKNVTLNSPEVRLLSDASISQLLTFQSGKIVSSVPNGNEKVIFLNNAIHSGASSSSFADVTVQKDGDDVFTFPVGADTIYAPVQLSPAPAVGSSFSVRYFIGDPSDAGMDTAQRVGLQRITGSEYWKVERLAGISTPVFTFSFRDPGIPRKYITNPYNLSMARWNGVEWESKGYSDVSGTRSGTVASNNMNDYGFYTFGTLNVNENPFSLEVFTFYADVDGDGYGDPNSFVESGEPDVPVGYVVDNTDCDDTDNTVYPGAPELCDGKDNDCNNLVDDGIGTTWYADADGDGYGDANVSIVACTQPVGYVSNNTDCDDADNTVYPGAPELCDGKDNDCNNIVDDGVGNIAWYADADGDGYGDANVSVMACTQPVGYVSNNTDCDDTDNTVYPGAPELCDGKDNDCNNLVDDGIGTTWYADADGDGYGDANVSIMACTQPVGYVSNSTDCDDTDNTVYPGAPELCDGKDNDCNNLVDDGIGTTWYADADSDGYGDANVSVIACTQPVGYVSNSTDCDDTDNTVYPGAPELCDGKDNDCNNLVDDGIGTTWYADADGDGYGDANVSIMACTQPVGYVSNSTDCDDTDNTVYPGAPELCDGKDNDCNNLVDDGIGTTWYADADSDGYGDANVSVIACTQPVGYVSNSTDCDDTDNTVYPGAPELCDGKDNDCNNIIDDGVGNIAWYADADGDGYGDVNNSVMACVQPVGYVSNSTDCDDTDNTVYPGAPELCDGKDNDCNNLIDDGAAGVPTITGLVNMCPFEGTNTPIVFTANSDNANSYQWTVPPTVQIVSGQGTDQLTVNILPGFTAGANKQIRVVAFGSCGSSEMAIHYLLAQLPGTIDVITGVTSVCGLIDTNVPVTYSTSSSVAATSYQWTVPAGVNIVTGQGTTDLTVTFDNAFATSTISVFAQNDCGISNVRSLTVSRSLPATPGLISGSTNPCMFMPSIAHPLGITAVYRVPLISGSSFNWSVPSGVTIEDQYDTPDDNVIEVSFSGSYGGGDISVTADNGCGISPARTLTLRNLRPGTPSGIDIDIENENCPNRVVVYSLSAMPSNSTSVEWTVPAGATIESGQGTTSIRVTYSDMGISGNITATANNGCNNSGVRSLKVKLPNCEIGEFKAPPMLFTQLSENVDDIMVFPNPSTGAFNIVTTKTKTPVMLEYQLTNQQGSVIASGRFMSGQSFTLNKSLRPGVYFLRTTHGNSVVTKRLVRL